MIRLMLVDDHAMLREGLRSKFERCADIEIVAEAGAAEELMSLLTKARPDVVIVDIKLPDANGIFIDGADQEGFVRRQGHHPDHV